MTLPEMLIHAAYACAVFAALFTIVGSVSFGPSSNAGRA